MRLTGHQALKFDTLVPLYNWIYPISGRPRAAGGEVFDSIPASRSRALYVHVPFCDTICTFCPFVRAAEHDVEIIEAYVRALIREIEIKGRIAALTNVPVGAVFFGGGTPSVLTPDQIRRIGTALHASFDLAGCREFSFEFEVKSVTPERAEAAREIGVTHARFGVQTLVPELRTLFNLTSSVEQVRDAAQLLRGTFPHVSCDLLVGMHGQSEEELFQDVQDVCALGLDNIDCYPINNLVTQPRLHRGYREAGRRPTPGLTKFYMVKFVRALLREHGFLPHNGHGYVRCTPDELARSPLITDTYSFVYHEHTLGYPDHDLLGFGVNALSSFRGCTISNEESRDAYVRSVTAGELPVRVGEHDPWLDACRPLSLALPYHGSIPRSWVNREAIPRRVLENLDAAIEHGLVVADDETFALTADGLDWYTNLMFFLLPDEEQRALGALMGSALRDTRRDVEPSRVNLPVVDA